MKHFLLLTITLGLCACAGNPPDWWNPSGTYNTGSQKATSSKTSVKSAHSASNMEEIPAEEDIDTSFEEYEEINLMDTAEVTEASVTQPVKNFEETSEQADPMYAAEEDLPSDGSLPDPTVLE